MGVKKEVNFTIDKQKALKIAKKAATEKFAMMKDEGFTFKVGAPMMTATVEVGDGKITVTGGGPGATVAETVYQCINSAFEDLEESQSAGAAPSNNVGAQPQVQVRAFSIDDQLKIVEVLKAFKELLDSGIITEEEFNKKKTELLEATSISSGIQVVSQKEGPVTSFNGQTAAGNGASNEPNSSPEGAGEPIDYEALADQGKEYFNVTHQYEKAFECFSKAAAGSPRAKFNLYICYLYGYGTSKNIELAVKYLTEAAEEGFEKAAEELKKIKS